MAAPVGISFVGKAAKTACLKRRVLEIAQSESEFPEERVVDFGDQLAGWEELTIDGVRKREFEPAERLPIRGGLLRKNLRKNVVPQVLAGATLGFFDRLGFDAWYGANGHRLDLQTLRLWEALLEHCILPLGLSAGLLPPALYVHTDGDDLLERLLRVYCKEVPGQNFEIIPAHLAIEEQAWCIVGLAHR